jgi:CBS domain-containing protein/ribosome-associated translation inhibitor RaiA
MAVFISKDKKIGDIVEYIKKGEDIIVTDNNGKPLGVLENSKAIRYLYRSDTKIEKVVNRIKPLKTNNIIDIVEKLISSNSRVTFVRENGKIKIVNIYDVLKEILNDKDILRKMNLNEIINDAYTIYEDENIKRAIGIMKDKGISRLIVLDKNNKVSGIISLTDILKYMLIDNSNNIRTPNEKDFDIKIKSIISNRLIFANKDDNIEKIINLMIENKVFSLPILDNGNLIGIITAKDILINYLQHKKEKEYNLVVHGVSLDEIDMNYIKKLYEKFYKKYRNVLGENIRLLLHIKKINEDKANKKIYYQIRAKLIYNNGKFSIDDHGYDLYSTIKDIFSILENEAEKIKHKNEDKYMLESMFKNDIIHYL